MRLSRQLRTWLTAVGAFVVGVAVLTGLVLPSIYETVPPDKWEWAGVVGLIAMDPQRITDAAVKILKAWKWGNGKVESHD